ncbi:hypothetical protein MUN81_15400 [Hymenobacter sp. 5317J-9]|uniref:hypothetical protein n=1 Tax=Hymenobacter sp. 5317J-9 TaxID=2932250 RepID=UPI001FD63539|nr:hypothetical protein [Hymenobacter sp. 5317J-9]UOQ96621.1 hypothetical protein MUN81_15400 [Hymenobacter sp. 5317J-9]
MALKKFDLVNTEGLKGLNYKGDFIPFEKITDELAEQLEGKTHVLKRKTTAQVQKALAAEAAEATK